MTVALLMRRPTGKLAGGMTTLEPLLEDSRYSDDAGVIVGGQPLQRGAYRTAVTAGRVPSRTSTSSPNSESSTKHLQREGKMLQKSRRLGEWDGRVGSQESGGSGVAAEG